MKDEQSIDGKPSPTSFWLFLFSIIAFFGVLIASDYFVLRSSRLCYYPLFSQIALNFVVFIFSFSALIAVWSCIPEMMRSVADVYPDPEGRGEWHARQSHRLAAISNVGYALVLLACGWMFPYGNAEIWQYFPVVAGIGFSIVVLCRYLYWLKHAPFRHFQFRVYALQAKLFAVTFFVGLIIWVYWPFYFDPVAVVLNFALSGVIANLYISVRDQMKFKKIKANDGSQT
jgi:hypothetical protein